jgi:sugar phosphate isomerase/epimerase
MSVFRLLVTGSRNWCDWLAVDRVFTPILLAQPRGTEFVIVHGASPDGRPRRGPGLDYIADCWARSATIAARYPRYRITAEPHRALWEVFGNAAGSLRNQAMVDLGANLCVGFPLPGSIGTWDCMARARKADINVFNAAA